MNQRTAMQWIVDEVDDLVAAGVLSPESGAALRRHYGQKLVREETGSRMVLLSVLGAALIGAGVILVIAHNWEDLGRPVRTLLSLLPLLVSLAISLFTLLKRAGSTAWREGAGVAQSAGVAASIALVSQTYHIEGELSDFLFTWLLLILPLPYLLRAVMPALVYLAGIAVWAGTNLESHGSSNGYWLFLAAMLPFYADYVRRDRLGKATAWLSAFVGLSASFGVFFTYAHDSMQGLWIPAFSGLFGVLYLTGAMVFPERRHHALRTLGALGIIGLTLFLSYNCNWHGVHAGARQPDVQWLAYVLAAAFPLAALGVLGQVFWRKADFNLAAALFPVVALITYGLSGLTETSNGTVNAVIFNLYGFALALGTALRGMRQRETLTLNGGLLLFAALIIARFADDGFGALERGIAFIVIGGLVLGANLWMLKAKKEGVA